MSTIPITTRGAEKLKAELHRLKTVDRPSVISAIAEARAQGLHVATGSQRDLAAAQVIFSSLPDDDALRTVGSMVAHNAAPGTVYVDTSTVSQAASAQVAQACAASGVAYLRCTVSGNNKMAEAALLRVQPGPRRLLLQLAPGSASGTHTLGEWPAAWLAGLGAPWNTLQLGGTLQLRSPGLRLQIADGRWTVAGQAELKLADMASPLTSLPRLGSYRVQLDAGKDDGSGAGMPQFVLGTLDGALQLDGQGQWTGSHWRFRGQAR